MTVKDSKTKRKRLSLIWIAESVKFYTSLCLGTIAFISMLTFLFLIPFVVDPAITTLMANYDRDPVTCVVTDHVYTEGLRNCSWSSCREGCTREATKCHQLTVNYSLTPFRLYFGGLNTSLQWDVVNTHFLVNPEGCGYPPSVNCTQFARLYGYNNIGTPFPCYYSRMYVHLVVANYSWENTLRHLVLSITVPNLLFAFSVAVLSSWYCPGCGKSSEKYTPHYTAEEVEVYEETPY